MTDKAKQEQWKKENTVLFSVRLQKSTDADIIEYLSKCESRQGAVKDAIRKVIASEK